ncbi:MAG: NUDIX domain-containing protein [bacterium]
MPEIATVYNIANPCEPYPMERESFYDEQIKLYKKGRQPEQAIAIFDVLLFNTKKEIILQKRSHSKRHNPYLIDKTVGGHIQYGDTPYYTAMIETVQELRIPSVVLREEENFKYMLKKPDKSLESTALLKLIDNNIYMLDNFMDGQRITTAKNIWMFLGFYDGPVWPVEADVSGVLYYELDVLKDEMKRMPELFTPDLHFMMDKYEFDIKKLLKILG